MTPLHGLLARRIAATGPMTVADYMAECLLHPVHGYYTTREPFGATGDFVTAPEISQMYGECLGLCLAQAWIDLGRPAPFTLAELGPGRGTLMADLLRATRRVDGFHAVCRVVLVEASPRLRTRQAETLRDHPVEWETDIAALPEAPLFLIANEFFDALPIRQFLRAADGWHERVLGLDGDRLVFGLAPAVPVAALAHRLADTAPGEMVEVCPAAPGIMATLAARIAAHGGVALIVDYGDRRSRGDTLQALCAGTRADPLAEPGQADLTAHVDFAELERAAQPCATALVPQGLLLDRLGIAARAERLAAGLSGDALSSHLAAHRRLTHPAEMGTLFKALAVHAPGTVPPPGFP
jgi:NADH dehydrogenase [ubiquinone] 1 alpha subcomplex assembly factor 7